MLEENWKRCVAEDGVLRFALLHTGLDRSCMVMLYSWYVALYCVFLSLVVFQGLLFCFSASCYYKPSALQFCLEHVCGSTKRQKHMLFVFSSR